ncbi:MAG: bifunctional (p)ppGpp synthetase/guanosine-3',5'-bis(diphosphate) 3'-pyrophosphohydrolase [Ruminococcaceae bacterium]|nr:bifunctional (p)ppGpp synthetase/guanosine-3',5'-bis(diphosphate) 3'-pyrophosphohydrolase [Oscillospiraceae bacterium]
MEEEKYLEIQPLLEIINKTGRSYDIDKIKQAFIYAKDMHDGQLRLSGEPYIMHPVNVAEIVAGLGLDTDSICAAFLHDTVEDCPDKTDLTEITRLFGSDVALLVDGVTKIKSINIEDKEEAQIESIRKMLLAMSKDIRVIFIKLCDRVHNMRTLYVKKDAKRRATALETMHVYAPLAHRLGMQKLKQELESYALQYLDPFGYDEVKGHIDEKYGMNVNFIENVKKQVSEMLKSININFSLGGRVKTVYSVYRKMYNQNKSFDEIYDFYALRIIVDTELECYTVLGLIHEMFKSVPGRFKDYISTPKPNMYQSLHTTVIGKDGIPFEVQIRTRKMHQIAEYGIAAHWKYKSGEKSSSEIDDKLDWISKLIDIENEAIDAEDFMHAFKIDIFHDETFVFTPKGDVITLPKGATLIDFAYTIHTGVGNKMVGAKINGRIAPIDSEPKNGDIVEIITSNISKGPSRDWLNIVKTGEARNKIRQWFKKEKRAENIIVGKTMIEKEFTRLKRNCTEEERTVIISNVVKRFNMSEIDDFYNALGYGGLAISKVATKIKDEYEKVFKDKEIKEIPFSFVEQSTSKKKKKSTGGVIVDGEDGCVVKFAKCCNPLPGEHIIGFITKGYGISIHKADCPNVKNAYSHEENATRFVKAEWDTPSSGSYKSAYDSSIQILVTNRMAILAEISMALSEMKVDIVSISTKNVEDTTIISMTISCRDIGHFNSILSRIRGIKDVIRVTRVMGTR